MAQYINKDALVTEIERLKEYHVNERDDFEKGYHNALNLISSFLGTIEAEEWDFEKELDRIWFDNKLGDYFNNDALDFAHIRTLCRHFFELGLKAQKGE